jgi:hypothetical protein
MTNSPTNSNPEDENMTNDTTPPTTWIAGDQLDLYVNQACRDAQVLAVVDGQMLLEYEMPAGHTGLQLVALAHRDGYAPYTWVRTYGYTRVPKKWLRAIQEQGEAPYWQGRSQSRTVDRDIPFPEGERQSPLE